MHFVISSPTVMNLLVTCLGVTLPLGLREDESKGNEPIVKLHWRTWDVFAHYPYLGLITYKGCPCPLIGGHRPLTGGPFNL